MMTAGTPFGPDSLRTRKSWGSFPPDAELTGRNEYVEAWESLTQDEKKVFARHMEVFAGFLEHADAQISRVLDFPEKIGVCDNTLVVLLSDNGASSEGGQDGNINQESGLQIDKNNDNVKYAIDHEEFFAID